MPIKCGSPANISCLARVTYTATRTIPPDECATFNRYKFNTKDQNQENALPNYLSCFRKKQTQLKLSENSA